MSDYELTYNDYDSREKILPERDKAYTPVMEAIGLSIEFGGLPAVDDFNLTVGRTEICGLIGPNGAGKTTVFNLLTKVYQPTRGKILIDGRDTKGMSTIQVNRAGVARTFQNIRLFKNMSVLENVLVARHMRLKAGLFASMLHVNQQEERRIRQESLDLLDMLGLGDVAQEKASSLPYGKQRYLEIARALATEPRLLLLDEPAAGMNPQETDELSDFIRKIKEDFKLTVFLIEHHMNLVMDISDRIYVLDFGKLISEGTPQQVQDDPAVIAAYLGVDEE